MQPGTTTSEDWILKTQARKQYNFSDADFASLSPISVTKNPRGGPYPVIKYSKREVEALACRLREAAGFSENSGKLAKSNGTEILHTTARKKYNLTREQMGAIRPVRISPNPHGDQYPSMKHYNLCDVVALANRLAAARTDPALSGTTSGSTPASAQRPARKATQASSSKSSDEDFDGEWKQGAFDGMSAGDAIAKFNRIMHYYGLH